MTSTTGAFGQNVSKVNSETRCRVFDMTNIPVQDTIQPSRLGRMLYIIHKIVCYISEHNHGKVWKAK